MTAEAGHWTADAHARLHKLLLADGKLEPHEAKGVVAALHLILTSGARFDVADDALTLELITDKTALQTAAIAVTQIAFAHTSEFAAVAFEDSAVGLFKVRGLWPVACGLWSVVCGLWSVVCGLWPVACGL